MHATMGRRGDAEAGRPIRGTFYPSDGSQRGAGFGSALPKILAVLAVMVVLRTVARAAGHAGHGGSSRWSRRRAAIAEFHRELHAQDDGGQEVASASEGVNA